MFRSRNNPPAYPRSGFYPDTSGDDYDHVREMLPSITVPQDGMTLFDHYAGLALKGMLANPTTFGDARFTALLGRAEAQDRVDQIAGAAVVYAHAMMKARAAYLELPLEPRAHDPEGDE